MKTRRIEFLGCPLDRMTSDDLLEELKEKVRAHSGASVIQFVNANKVAQVHADPAMEWILKRADYVLADGQPILPMAKMLGQEVPERIDGIGLVGKLLALANAEGFSVYLLGAKQEVVEECVRRIRQEYPNVRVAGYRNGYFKADEVPAIAKEVAGTHPDFLFLGMGSPMKKRLADVWRDEFGAAVIQGVGGSFDVMAGFVRRAPGWMQRMGMEWLYRVLQEPRRMFGRYLKTNSVCLWLFIKALMRRMSPFGRHQATRA